MSERIALDYTHGVKEDLPDSTWSNIDPDRVIELARRHIADKSRICRGMSLRALASLVEPTLSAELTRRLEGSLTAT